jgi:HTH-type transcriptional regulator/antitoxin HipB
MSRVTRRGKHDLTAGRAGASVLQDKEKISCLRDYSVIFGIPDMSDYIARTPRQLGAILRGYRRERKLTQQAVGKVSGLPQGAVSQIESDPATSSLSRIYRMLAALDLELVVRPRGAIDRKTEW